MYEALNNSSIVQTAPKVSYASFHENVVEKTPAYHRVKRGETLGDIADNYGIDLKDLKAWNHLHSSKAIVGQRLKLSESNDDTEETASTSTHHRNYIVYKVKTGDTLNSIASKFDGASVEKIKSLNGLKKGRLQPGMTIKINRG